MPAPTEHRLDAPALETLLRALPASVLANAQRYAGDGRVEIAVGNLRLVKARVGGLEQMHQVTIWTDPDGGGVEKFCSCPAFTRGCKHVGAVALVVKARFLEADAEGAPTEAADRVHGLPGWESADHARAEALDERRAAARRDALEVIPRDDTPTLEVVSGSGFSYDVRVRGGAKGPHRCTCPDFETNLLHTCKHVERVRRYLSHSSTALPALQAEAAARPCIYLHFGERLEPRLFRGWPEGESGASAAKSSRKTRKKAGRPRGAIPQRLDRAFSPEGRLRAGAPEGEADLLAYLEANARHVDPVDLAWLRARAARVPKLPTGPLSKLTPSLKLKPYPYQWTGIEFLARRGRALLADEMGLGKTVQAIVAATVLRHAQHPARRVTIVCPTSLKGPWKDEIERWIGEEALLLEGPRPGRLARLREGAPWLITNYEQVLRDHEAHRQNPPDLLILDEAQRVKNYRTKTSRMVKAIPSRYLFALTGTPLENRLEEAYSMAQLIDQRLLPPLWQIERDHFLRSEESKQVVQYRNLDQLRARLAPTFLRRRKEDVDLELPERVTTVFRPPMHEAAEAPYAETMLMISQLAARASGSPHLADRIQRLLVRARRCCDSPHLVDHDRPDEEIPKLAELKSLLEEICLGESRKVVIFSEWTGMTDRVKAMVDRLEIPCFYLQGKVPSRARPMLLRGFSKIPAPAVFLSTESGGVGLNLQAADTVINLDLPWNPARLDQRLARVHRIGSKRKVQVILMITKDSLEERIETLHKSKRDALENIWTVSDRGEDEMVAPGGSGAFQKMLQSIIVVDTRSSDPDALPEVEEEEGLDQRSLDELRRVSQLTAAQAIAQGELEDPRARTRVQKDRVVAPTMGAGAVVPAFLKQGTPAPPPTFTQPLADAPLSAPEAAEGQALVYTALGQHWERPAPPPVPPAPAAPALDPATIATAVAAVAPTLPPEHRQSLAAVFGALAAALGGEGGE